MSYGASVPVVLGIAIVSVMALAMSGSKRMTANSAVSDAEEARAEAGKVLTELESLDRYGTDEYKRAQMAYVRASREADLQRARARAARKKKKIGF